MVAYTYLGKDFSNRFGINFFTFTIDSVSIKDICCDPHALYIITVKQGKNSWIVNKRYKDFFALKYDVEYGEDMEFPAKTWFRCLDPTFLENRKEQLSSFLQLILHKHSANNYITEESTIWKFLQNNDDDL